MAEKKRILIVDDDTEIRDLLEFDISSSGYIVSTLEAAMWVFLNSNDYNSAILKAIPK